MQVGIDVGSQTSRVSVCLDGRVSEPKSFPSTIALTDQLLVGKDAMREMETRHCNTMRHLTAGLRSRRKYKLTHRRGHKEVSIELAFAVVFEKLKKMAESHGTIKSCALAVPAALTTTEIERIRSAALAMGLKGLQVIPSTIAVAMHYYHTSPTMKAYSKTQTCLVVDVGCRFTAASVVQLSKGSVELVATKALRMGGYDIDKMLLNSITLSNADDVHPATLQAAVEKAKKDLSSLRETVVQITDSKTTVSRGQLDDAAAPYLTRLNLLLTKLTAANPDISVALLVGGGGRMLRVRELVASGGDRGMNLPIEVMDYDFSCVQGCVKWMEANEGKTAPHLRSSRCSAFRFWTRDPNLRAPRLMFDAGSRDWIKEGSRFMYQQLLVANEEDDEVESQPSPPPPPPPPPEQSGKAPPTRCNNNPENLPAPSLEEFERAHEAASPISPSPPPVEGILLSEPNEVTVIYDVTNVPPGTEFRLRLDGTPFSKAEKSWKSYSPLVLDSNGVDLLKEELNCVKAERRLVEEMAEKRNYLEEATLRTEELEMEDMEEVLPNISEYTELANSWLNGDDTDPVPLADFGHLTDLLHAVADECEDAEGNAETRIGSLQRHLEKYVVSGRESSARTTPRTGRLDLSGTWGEEKQAKTPPQKPPESPTEAAPAQQQQQQQQQPPQPQQKEQPDELNGRCVSQTPRPTPTQTECEAEKVLQRAASFSHPGSVHGNSTPLNSPEPAKEPEKRKEKKKKHQEEKRRQSILPSVEAAAAASAKAGEGSASSRASPASPRSPFAQSRTPPKEASSPSRPAPSSPRRSPTKPRSPRTPTYNPSSSATFVSPREKESARSSGQLPKFSGRSAQPPDSKGSPRTGTPRGPANSSGGSSSPGSPRTVPAGSPRGGSRTAQHSSPFAHVQPSPAPRPPPSLLPVQQPLVSLSASPPSTAAVSPPLSAAENPKQDFAETMKSVTSSDGHSEQTKSTRSLTSILNLTRKEESGKPSPLLDDDEDDDVGDRSDEETKQIISPRSDDENTQFSRKVSDEPPFVERRIAGSSTKPVKPTITPALVRSPSGHGYERHADMSSTVKLNSSNQPEIQYTSLSETVPGRRRRSFTKIESIEKIAESPVKQGTWKVRSRDASPRRRGSGDEVLRERRGSAGDVLPRRGSSTTVPSRDFSPQRDVPTKEFRRGSTHSQVVVSPTRRHRSISVGRVEELGKRRASLGVEDLKRSRATRSAVNVNLSTTVTGTTSGLGLSSGSIAGGQLDKTFGRHTTAPTLKARRRGSSTGQAPDTGKEETRLRRGSTSGNLLGAPKPASSGDKVSKKRSGSFNSSTVAINSSSSSTILTTALSSARSQKTQSSQGDRLNASTAGLEVDDDYTGATEVKFISGGGEVVEFCAEGAHVALKVNGVKLLQAVVLKYDSKRSQLIAYQAGDTRGTGGQVPSKGRREFIVKLAAVAATAGVECRGFGTSGPIPRQHRSHHAVAATSQPNIPPATTSSLHPSFPNSSRDRKAVSTGDLSDGKRAIVDTVMEIFNMDGD